jgi:hypothetical protein
VMKMNWSVRISNGCGCNVALAAASCEAGRGS